MSIRMGLACSICPCRVSAGRHQFANAAGAIAALRAVLPELATAGRHRGRVAHCRMAGTDAAPWRRSRRADAAGAELWLDGGHNADGGRAIATAFAELEERAPRPLILITAMLTSKESDQFLKHFAGLARQVFTIAIASQDHAARSPEDLARLAREIGLKAATAGDLRQTLAFIRAFDWPCRRESSFAVRSILPRSAGRRWQPAALTV